jgi:hypothetical protein
MWKVYRRGICFFSKDSKDAQQQYLEALRKLSNDRLRIEVASLGLSNIGSKRQNIKNIKDFIEKHPEEVESRLKFLSNPELEVSPPKLTSI